MSSSAHGETVLDTCAICRGSFFEPQRLVEKFGREAAPAHWVDEHCAQRLGETRMLCPVDGGHLTAYAVSWENEKNAVEVDVCAVCKGLWLDEGEGEKLAATLAAHNDERGLAESLTIKGYFFQLLTGFPVELWNPRRTKPIAVRLLVWSLVLIHLALAAFVAVDVEGGTALFHALALVPSNLLRGEGLHTVVTHGFLHLGLIHLVGNAYMLWIFGDNVEDKIGVKRFLVLFMLALVVGGLTHALDGSALPMVGASGAVSGVMAAYFVMFPRVKLRLVWFFIPFKLSIAWYFGGWLVLQSVMAMLHAPSVAWLAHLGGAAMGLVIGKIDRGFLVDRALHAAETGSVLIDKAPAPTR
jgi:membrane associated rhomboid family serine protease/Zn-finger nucleic acid-binding protein